MYLTSLIYTLLCFVIPGELALVALAPGVPILPRTLSLGLLNVLTYGGIWLILRFARIAHQDLVEPDSAMRQALQPWLQVNGGRWLNVLGLLAVGGGAALLTLDHRLPLPFFYLLAAIAIGMAALLLSADPPLKFPEILPPMRADPTNSGASDPLTGQESRFSWRALAGGSATAYIEQELRLAVNQQEYEAARTQPRFPFDHGRGYVRHVTEGFTDTTCKAAVLLRQQSIKHSLCPVQELMNVVAFVRSLRYATDEQTHHCADWANFPIETLYERQGDCEDHAILAAALLHLLGHDVALFFLTLTDSAHAALGYHTDTTVGFYSASAEGREFLYVETVPTEASHQLGDISRDFLRNLKSSQVLPIA